MKNIFQSPLIMNINLKNKQKNVAKTFVKKGNERSWSHDRIPRSLMISFHVPTKFIFHSFFF